MIKRYLLASFLIILVAVAAAGAAYKAKDKLTYNASCTVEVFLRAPALSQGNPGPDFLTFTNNLAANAVSLATPTVYGDLAKSQKLSVGEVASKIQILPAIGIGAFRVSATDSDPKRTKSLASAGCSTYVAVVARQRADSLAHDLKAIQDRIDSTEKSVSRLAKIPSSRRTASQTLELATEQETIRTNSLLIVQYKTLPPDNITLLTPATNVASVRAASLKKYLLIAAVGALLLIFLYILVLEAVSPQRKDTSPA
jgi:hypothetical protein